MHTIGPKTIEAAEQLIGGLLRMYREKIDKAYLKAEKSLVVAAKIKFSPSDNQSGIDVDASINFVTDQIKDSLNRTIDENQGELFNVKEIVDAVNKVNNNGQVKWFSLPKQWMPDMSRTRKIEWVVKDGRLMPIGSDLADYLFKLGEKIIQEARA